MGSNAHNDKEKKAAEERRARFLACLRGSDGALPMSIRRSCDAVGVSRSTVRTWCEQHPDFQEAFRDAVEDGIDVYEDEAVRRAVEGVSEPVFHAGVVVGDKQRYSDGLLETLLAGNRAKYGRGASISVTNNNAQIAHPSDDQLARAMALLLAEAKVAQLEKVE